jgi:ankyrin repeat protein/serine/threonine protein kinase
MGGACPGCLLAVGLSPASGPDPFFIAPAPGELKALFPELEVVSLLGQGGMGAVYKVRQPALDRFAALKLLPVEADLRPGFRERFQREARTLASLNHPHIVTVYDFGERQGHFFFLMEFVEGGDLRDLIHSRRLGSREALAIVSQICEALQYAHENGVVHRDIKPGNILLNARGGVKIADFGVAKLLGRADAGVPANYVLGTPRYMAPEQLERPVEVDHRADLYSLGVVLYEMLTGELPAVRLEPPSRRVDVDVRIDDVVRRALESDPTRRFQHASEIRDRVEHVLTPRRGHGRWPAVAAGVAVVGAAAVVLLRPHREPPSPPPPLPFPEAVENSLGMRFRPVPGLPVLFSIWETRVSDWQAFARDENSRPLAVPSFPQDPDHPQTGVWLDAAEGFCRWLTSKERTAGLLKPDEQYRLPTDDEWSVAAGLREAAAASPADLHLKIRDHYPWGSLAPIPAQAGNYPDRTLLERLPQSRVVAGYYDGYPTTAPVGRFRPNAFGLFDLGGNVWEVTSSVFAADKVSPSWRGAAWDGLSAGSGWEHLATSFRATDRDLDQSAAVRGFRVVRARSARRPSSLLAAVREGRAAEVQAALSGGSANLGEKDVFGRTPLVLAIRGGDEAIIDLLLEAGVDVSASDPAGRTPLHEAAAAGRFGVIKRLIARGAAVEARAKFGQRPLHEAAASGSVPAMEALVEAGAQVSRNDDPMTTPLTEALGHRRSAAALWLLDHGSDPHGSAALAGVFAPLVFAVFSGDLAVATRLLAMGVPADTSFNGLPVLNFAAMSADPDMVRLLVEKGAEATDPAVLAAATVTFEALVERAASGGMGSEAEKPLFSSAPVRAALRSMALQPSPGRRAEVIRFLLAKGAPLEVRTADGLTPLMRAAWFGEREAVEVLLEAGADVEPVDNHGFNALHSALEYGHHEIARLLVARGARLDVRTEDGRTPLSIAATAGNEETVDFLLGAGADANAADDNGMTPLKKAAIGGWSGVTLRLLHGGAHPNVTGEDSSSTALHFAAAGLAGNEAMEAQARTLEPSTAPIPKADAAGYVEVARALLDHGAHASARNQEGQEPLHLAARYDAEEVAALLLERGASLEAVDQEFRTPLHHAAMGNAVRTTRLLLDRGAVLAPLLAGSSPMHLAAASGSVEVAQVLHAKGAGLDPLDNHAATPLLLAIAAGQTRMAMWLLEAGADLEKRDTSWMTPLHRAVHAGSADMVRLLCERGANLDARDAASATPLHYAESLRQPEIRSILMGAATARRPPAASPTATK